MSDSYDGSALQDSAPKPDLFLLTLGSLKVFFSLKTSQDEQGSSQGKALALQAWWLELEPQDTHKGGRREGTPQSCPLISSCMPWNACFTLTAMTTFSPTLTFTHNLYKGVYARVPYRLAKTVWPTPQLNPLFPMFASSSFMLISKCLLSGLLSLSASRKSTL